MGLNRLGGLGSPIVLAVALFAGMAVTLTAWGLEGDGPMSETSETAVAVGRIASFEPPNGNSDGSLRLRDGTACVVKREMQHYSLFAELIAKAQEHNWYVFMRFSTGTRELLLVAPSTVHQVQWLRPDPEGAGLRVLLTRSQAIYLVRSSRKNAAEMQRVLEEALSAKSWIVATTNTDGGELIDVRPRPPED